jgi:hypothetical protein
MSARCVQTYINEIATNVNEKGLEYVINDFRDRDYCRSKIAIEKGQWWTKNWKNFKKRWDSYLQENVWKKIIFRKKEHHEALEKLENMKNEYGTNHESENLTEENKNLDDAKRKLKKKLKLTKDK